MTSKSLFIKLTRESVKRRISILVIFSLICFFTFIVSAMLTVGRASAAPWDDHDIQSFLFIVSHSNLWVAFCMVIMAVVCGISSFSYLSSRSKVDFYHSLPISRGMLFGSNFTAGYLLTIIPYTISWLVCILIGIVSGIKNPTILIRAALMGFLFHLVFYLLVYATAVLAVMLTGHIVISFLGCMTFFFYFPTLILILVGYTEVNFSTYYSSTDGLLQWLMEKTSPVTAYFNSLGLFQRDQSVKQLLQEDIFGALIVSVVLIIVNLYLYKKRPSEGAGKALVFKVSRPIIRIFIVILFTLIMTMVFGEMQESIGWGIFGLLCGAVISHCLMEAIYHFDVKKVFANWEQLIICIGLAIAIVSFFKFDLIGYDNYIPKNASLRSAAVNIQLMDSWVEYETDLYYNGEYYRLEDQDSDGYIFKNMSVSDPELVLQIAQKGVDWNNDVYHYTTSGYVTADERIRLESLGNTNTEETISNLDYGDYGYGGYDPYTSVNIQYTMKSGRKVRRTYYLPITLIYDQMDQLTKDQNYMTAKYPFLNDDETEFVELNYREDEAEYENLKLSNDQIKVIYEAYKNDFMKRDLEIEKQGLPIAELRFTTAARRSAIDHNKKVSDTNYYYGNDIDAAGYLPLYSSFEETIKALKEVGVPVGEMWRAYQISEIELHGVVKATRNDYMPEEDTWLQNGIITDEAAIEDIMKQSVMFDTKDYNILYNYRDMVDITINYETAFGTSSLIRRVDKDLLLKWR